MAEVRHLVSGAIASTDEDSVKRLLESGQWELVKDAPKKRAPKADAPDTETE